MVFQVSVRYILSARPEKEKDKVKVEDKDVVVQMYFTRSCCTIFAFLPQQYVVNEATVSVHH